MTVMSRFSAGPIALAAMIACALPISAMAQDAGGSSGPGGSNQSSASKSEGKGGRGGGSGGKRTTIAPYIEAAQVVTAELSPGDDVLTYTAIAAGVDAEIIGANNGASASVRYERRIGWGDAEDSDAVSGVVRGYSRIARGVQIDAGALAARTRIDERGSSVVGSLATGDAVTQVYSLYAGPSVATQAGDVTINANYRIGYTKVEDPKGFTATPGGQSVDVFDESTIHVASVHAGVRPYEVLPIGLGAGAQYYREDISNLDQRIEDFRARVDVTVPVSQTLALVGGLGYEDVEISSRDALREADGTPVIGPGGRYVTDESGPRIMAYDVEGLVWDAGVMWRPSSRTSLEAHVGRRYGTTSVYGTFSYTPNSRSSLNIAVYDNVAGFGGQVNRALADLPEEFSALRNPLTGDLGGCVAATEGNNCLASLLGSVRSSTFRGRGVTATYAYQVGRIATGIGAGYDRRRFIAAPGTILASANGVVDENYWLAAYLNGRIDARSNFSTNVYANWFKNGTGFAGDTSSIGATAAYNRLLTDRLSATAALGLDMVNESAPFEDVSTVSALLGMRYSF